MLLNLVDGGIVEIYSDQESYGGCSTCDYGSSYINLYTIKLTKGTIDIKTSKEYEYALTEDYMMKLILSNVEHIKQMEEKEFHRWLKTKIKNDIGSYAVKYVDWRYN
jgi:hypothetical protein